ncbi:hypothetical protein [Acetonema longum]|uniref:Uncharacterized protein n=1 Tax=Acetonema longum DSM 6540 TaxID=1009370 RepID=F7NJV2_9FIRM|nr:hypothetical protein [Acetonema longum]EGO63684.1 hypothetical protein ALO_11809 [Acetonema longum DSM 6540]
MDVVRLGSRMLSRTTPAGLILAGSVLALSMPQVRHRVKATTALALRGLLSLVEENGAPVMSYADGDHPSGRRECWQEFRDRSKGSARRAAVGAASGMISASDKAKELYEDMTHEIRGIIDEAKSSHGRTVRDRAGFKSDADPDPIPDDYERPRHDGGL